MTRSAYRADDELVSRDAFYALACDPQRSVVVEACAGAGKTWILVSRILRALLEGAQPHEILAITFTRKAAGEMRDRLNEWLREFNQLNASHQQRVQALMHRGVSAPQAQQLAGKLAVLHERILRGGRSVEIRTFHAWFSQMLRAAPLELLEELGLQRNMELIEDPHDHRAEVFRRFNSAVLRDSHLRADHATLIARRGRSQARKWLEAVWDKRVEFEFADAAGVLEQSVPAFFEQAHSPDMHGGDMAHPASTLLHAQWHSSLRALAQELGAGNMRARDAANGLELALAQIDAMTRFEHLWSALFTEKGAPRKQLGSIASLAAVQDELEVLWARIRQFEAHLEHLRLVRLSRVLLREFAAYKRSRGLADMSDLERGGLALLRDATLSGWVQERLDARIRHLLIDEFQDTSPLQWHALHAWLSAYAGAGGGSSGQRAPCVFIVGDPKQSIYRFRRAEPRVFEAAQEFVVQALGGTVLACDHTRRNAPEVLAPLNQVLSLAQRSGEFTGFRTHTTELEHDPHAGIFLLPRVARPARVERTDAQSAPWRDSLTVARHAPEEILREQEAALVAQAVAALLGAGQVRPADIFVLSRKRQSLRLAAQALRQLHVPYAAVEEVELMAAPEARDLVALLDALVSPRHRLSLAQALRSPLFGASDEDLVELAGRAPNRDWWRALTEGDAPSTPALRRARELLPRWRIAASLLPPHDLLDRIVHEGELRKRLAATVPAERRLAALDAVDAVLGQALSLDGARYATPYNFVRALKSRAIKVALPAHADAVQLLTVHGAKGLEAQIVFVMDADPEPAATETATLLIDWPVQAEHPRRCGFVYSEGGCPPSLEGLLQTEMLARQREELNGLYVAMTRAKQRIVFSATEPFRPSRMLSWWDRVAPIGTLFDPGDLGLRPVPLHSCVPHGAILEIKLPLPQSGNPAPAVAPGPGVRNSDSDSTRLGKAVHRVLEWATVAPAASEVAVTNLAEAAAGEFGASASATSQISRSILSSPSCARFFFDKGLTWSANEVSVSYEGQALRIDRLVQLQGEEGSSWWVLDYKLHLAPQQLQPYREQLLRYREAVRLAQPGMSVRCAFITGAGVVVEIN
jgi:ATP-dependent helicase/nuclease subunit A